ncbi:MAG: nucleotidyltransferase family protein [Gorillibacterium sp.]|nr:nucleotidyltransferase family protein [Gorillibacterium sp.]
MIWNLLHAIYDPGSPMPTEPNTLQTIQEDIEYFHIEPQLYHLLKQQNKLEDIPLAFRNQLKVKYDETMLLNLYIQYENEKIFKAFDDSSITVIPLKGVHLATKYFGHIGARGTSDIDLLVKAAELAQAEECIRSLGFTWEEENIRSHFHHSFSKPIVGSTHPLTVELHWGLLMEGTSRFNVEELWREALPMKPYSHVMELSDYHTFYMICLHGWKHGFDSVKYFIDIIQLITVCRDRIDYDRLFRDSVAHQTYKRISSTLSIVYRQFPYLESHKPLILSKRTGHWWNYAAIRGKQKRSLTRYLRFLQYHFLEYDLPSHSFVASILYLEPILMQRREVKTNG